MAESLLVQLKSPSSVNLEIFIGKAALKLVCVSYRMIPGWRRHWAVYDTSPQTIVKLAQQLWGLLINFDWLVHEVECLNFSTTYYCLQGGIFVYYH